MPTPAAIRQAVFSVLRIGLGLGLAAFMIRLTLRSAGGHLGAALATANGGLLVLATALYGGVICLTAWRWGILLRVQGVHLRFADLWRLTMIGQFFSLAIPGAVGGDLVKMSYIARRVPAGKVAESVLTIVLDRLIGILGLFTVASLMVLLNLPFLLALPPAHRAVQVAAFLVGLGSLGGIAAVLLVEYRAPLLRHPWAARLLAMAARRTPHKLADLVRRLVTALELCRQHRAAMTGAFAISVGVHSTLALLLFTVGHALGETKLSLSGYALATQVANAVAAVPVTPGGLGLRDFGIKLFFDALGAPAAQTGNIPVTMSLIISAWALLGAGVFIVTRAARPPGKPAA